MVLPDTQMRDPPVCKPLILWSGRGDLNARPAAPKGEAWLPKALFVRAHSLCLQQLGESAFRSEANPKAVKGMGFGTLLTQSG